LLIFADKPRDEHGFLEDSPVGMESARTIKGLLPLGGNPKVVII
jgi:hypothetical protein